MYSKFSVTMILTTILLSSVLSARSSSLKLQEAISDANAGQTQLAIEKLEQLKHANLNNTQVRLSLGLLYQSTDRIEKAIEELEFAYQLGQVPEAAYALGLLYEAKALQSADSTWPKKAKEMWSNYLRLTNSQDPRHQTASRHWNRLNEEGY